MTLEFWVEHYSHLPPHGISKPLSLHVSNPTYPGTYGKLEARLGLTVDWILWAMGIQSKQTGFPEMGVR